MVDPGETRPERDSSWRGESNAQKPAEAEQQEKADPNEEVKEPQKEQVVISIASKSSTEKVTPNQLV